MKFCENCGGQMEETEMFCPNCGKVQNMQDTVEPIMEQSQFSKQNMEFYYDNNQTVNGASYAQGNVRVKKKSKAPLIIGVSVGLVLLIAAVTVSIILVVSRNDGNGGSARQAAENFLKACFVRFDGKEAMNYIAYEKDARSRVREKFEYLDYMKDYIKKSNYQIVDEEKLSKSDIEDFWYDYEDVVYVGEEDVSSITKVKAKITLYSDEGEKDSENFFLYVGKYQGSWKVIYME